ncbi:MAG: hypothetical protein RLY31_3018 [Bacteroidota bacterium]|jgi:ADP-ribosylglycohydrolase
MDGSEHTVIALLMAQAGRLVGRKKPFGSKVGKYAPKSRKKEASSLVGLSCGSKEVEKPEKNTGRQERPGRLLLIFGKTSNRIPASQAAEESSKNLNRMNKTASNVRGAFLGLALGDALGVPVEFNAPSEMADKPLTGMIGYGTHHQPPGTWSDDSSLTFCLAESLLQGYDLWDMADRFVRWHQEAYWSARGEVFDIGCITKESLIQWKEILDTGDVGLLEEWYAFEDDQQNGNGSLMRVLPLLFHIKGMPIGEQFELIWQVSMLTHRHVRAAICCLLYLRVAERLWEGLDKSAAYQQARADVSDNWDAIGLPAGERSHLAKLIDGDISSLGADEIESGEYVIPTLEATLWAFLRHDRYDEAVLAGINLGYDTDTVGTLIGGLAGLHAGEDALPADWVAQLARQDDIRDLADRLAAHYGIPA